MKRALLGFILILSCNHPIYAATIGLGNLVAAEQAIETEKKEKARLISAENLRKQKAARIARNKRNAAAKQKRAAVASARAKRIEEDRLQARKLAMKLQLVEAQAQIATAKQKEEESAKQSIKDSIAQKERQEDRELEMMIKRAEVEAKIAALKADTSLANANAEADLNAKIQRTEATTDSIRAANDSKRLVAEGTKKLLILEGESRVIGAGATPVIKEVNVYNSNSN